MKILFYKNLNGWGGAENLLIRHKEYLKQKGEISYVLCLSDNLGVADYAGLSQIILFFMKNLFIDKHLYVHSSLLFGSFISWFPFVTRKDIFLHQPFTMSLNTRIRGGGGDRVRAWVEEMQDRGVDIYDWPHGSLASHVWFFLTKYLLRKYDNIYTLSSFSKMEKQVLFGLEANSFCGGFDRDRIDGPCLDYRLPTIKFVAVGRLVTDKRFEKIIEYLDVFASRCGHRVILTIIGDGPSRDSIQSAAKQAKSLLITVTGFVSESEKLNILRDSHIFISLDVADYIITACEALQAGCFLFLGPAFDYKSRLAELMLQNQVLYRIDGQESVLSSFGLIRSHSETSRRDKGGIEQIEVGEFTWDFYFDSLS